MVLAPRILHAIPGRLRVCLPECVLKAAEARLGRQPGVRSVRANPLTHNLLVEFDPDATSAEALLAVLADVCKAGRDQSGPAGDLSPYVRAGLYGVLGHALVDGLFYALVFAEPFGLPLAGLGALHLGADVVVWTAALAPLLGHFAGDLTRVRTA